MRFVIGLLAVIVLAAPRAAAAQDEAVEFHRFHAAILVGDTHGPEQNGFTFGGDVEFRPRRRFGVGLTGEHVSQPFRENIWVVAALVHPARGVKLTIGPGFEREAAEDPAHRIEQHPLLRVGAGYEFALPHGWTVDPDVAVDFVDGHRVAVYAVAIGKDLGRARH